ncbi:GNAT family N-acetyltransferase [Pseudoxanthomonas sp. LjRoot143]|uniref:GNAT family N-acetyltransferase n=1 Tax=Pseudoxanthomonas sp. LjRoot143 TaxID=3342266 RepID=UPI003ECC9B0C
MADTSFSLASPALSVLNTLLPVARRIFTEAFSHLYEREAFAAFCQQVYACDGAMSRDFSNPEVDWKVAIANGEVVGYAKLTPLRAPAVRPAPDSLELQQIYVLADWHGSGVAQALMEWAITTARDRGAEELYLTVFDHNQRAKRFYTRHGFEEVGHCTFVLGERVDDDRIWRKRLA